MNEHGWLLGLEHIFTEAPPVFQFTFPIPYMIYGSFKKIRWLNKYTTKCRPNFSCKWLIFCRIMKIYLIAISRSIDFHLLQLILGLLPNSNGKLEFFRNWIMKVKKLETDYLSHFHSCKRVHDSTGRHQALQIAGQWAASPSWNGREGRRGNGWGRLLCRTIVIERYYF